MLGEEGKTHYNVCMLACKSKINQLLDLTALVITNCVCMQSLVRLRQWNTFLAKVDFSPCPSLRAAEKFKLLKGTLPPFSH